MIEAWFNLPFPTSKPHGDIQQFKSSFLAHHDESRKCINDAFESQMLILLHWEGNPLKITISRSHKKKWEGTINRLVLIKSLCLTDSPWGLITVQWYPNLEAKTRQCYPNLEAKTRPKKVSIESPTD